MACRNRLINLYAFYIRGRDHFGLRAYRKMLANTDLGDQAIRQQTVLALWSLRERVSGITRLDQPDRYVHALAV